MTQPFKLIPEEARVATIEHGFTLQLDAFSIRSHHGDATFRFEHTDRHDVIVAFAIGKGRSTQYTNATFPTAGEAIQAAVKALLEGDAAWEALAAAQQRLDAVQGFLEQAVASAPT